MWENVYNIMFGLKEYTKFYPHNNLKYTKYVCYDQVLDTNEKDCCSVGVQVFFLTNRYYNMVW